MKKILIYASIRKLDCMLPRTEGVRNLPDCPDNFTSRNSNSGGISHFDYLWSERNSILS